MDAMAAPQALGLDFVVLGAQKSASTFLQHCLAQHPSVQMPPGESRHFEDPHYAQGAVEELIEELGPRRPGTLRGIKRPEYLARPPIAQRLAEWAPDARLFVVLREPVSRAVSGYFDYMRMGFLPLQPLDEGMAQILDGKLQKTHPRAADVLEYGLYGKHLSRYLHLVPREHLLVLLQPELREDPFGQVAEAYRFLGVDPAFVPTLPERRNTGVYSPVRLRLLRSRNRLLFDYTPDLTRRDPRPPSAVRRVWPSVVTGLDRYAFARLDRSGEPGLAPELREALQEFYADDAPVLEEVLGRPLPWDSGR
jgi:hypothetical protein